MNYETKEKRHQTMSVLEIPYSPPCRPISQLELQSMREKLNKHLRLSEKNLTHSTCEHYYRIKEGGRKAQNITENNVTTNKMNCSTCWKLHKTPEHLKKNASELIDAYQNFFPTNSTPKYLSFDMIDVEECFYTWLYEEFN